VLETKMTVWNDLLFSVTVLLNIFSFWCTTILPDSTNRASPWATRLSVILLLKRGCCVAVSLDFRYLLEESHPNLDFHYENNRQSRMGL
jgi:hypothetical protein